MTQSEIAKRIMKGDVSGINPDMVVPYVVNRILSTLSPNVANMISSVGNGRSLEGKEYLEFMSRLPYPSGRLSFPKIITKDPG